MGSAHTCTKCTNVGHIDDIYKKCESVSKGNVLQKDTRHKIKSHQVYGQIVQCKTCNTLKRSADVISDSLNSLKDKLESNVPIPLCHFIKNLPMLLPKDLVMLLIYLDDKTDATKSLHNKNNHDTAGLPISETHTKKQLANEPEGLRQFRDHS